jgi:transposase
MSRIVSTKTERPSAEIVCDGSAPDVDRVVHESGILAIWLTRELEKRGLPIVCIDARLAH